jgi:glutathione synthase/RimK-type ligase-like ATP-grasp enzyme
MKRRIWNQMKRRNAVTGGTMMSKLFVYPYKNYSASAKVLAKALGVKCIKVEGSKFRPNANKMILNWGGSRMPEEYLKCRVVNHPNSVERATNKGLALGDLQAVVRVPPFTTSLEEASRWVLEGPVVCRTILNGCGGAGIVIAETEQELVAAPLYTKYIKKKSEWRVHIFCDEVIMVQRKVRNMDIPVEEVNWKVRNHGNGFVFQQHGDAPPVEVITSAAKAIRGLFLDFGAVDVVYNGKEDKAYVLEVNTAPGLEGSTLERYVNCIQQHVNP